MGLGLSVGQPAVGVVVPLTGSHQQHQQSEARHPNHSTSVYLFAHSATFALARA